MAFYSNQPLPDTNARQAATTIRPSSTALLTIDSEDRYKDQTEARKGKTSPYNFAISKTESLMPGFMTRIGISEVVFPWVIPNINPKTRDITVSGSFNGGANLVTTTLTLDEGFYRPEQLASSFETVVQNWLSGLGFGGVFTATYGNDDYPRFTLSVTGATVDFLTFEPEDAPSSAYPYPPQTKQLFDVLGLAAEAPGSGSTVEPANNYIGGTTFCQAIRYVDLVCNQLTNSQAQKDQTSQFVARDMLCRIYIADTAGSGQSTISPQDPTFCPAGCAPFTIYRNFTMPKQIQWIPNQNIPGYLQFQVYDDAGALLDTSVAIVTNPNQAGKSYTATDWSMTMLISEC
jgi:hypothetical protein